MSDSAMFAGRIAGVISLLAFIPYIMAILKGKTKPNRASWWIWTVVGFMLGASYFYSGASHTIWVPISYIVGPFVTAVLAIRYGEGGWSRFDRCCLISSGLSALIWLVLKLAGTAWNPALIALSINLFIDLLGALPTVKKAYYEPEGEDRTAWGLFITANTLNLMAVETWTFAIAAYPIYMFLAAGTIAVLVILRPQKSRVGIEQ